MSARKGITLTIFYLFKLFSIGAWNHFIGSWNGLGWKDLKSFKDL